MGDSDAHSVFLRQAVALDKEGKYSAALNFYAEGISKLLEAIPKVSDPSSVKYLKSKATEYMERAEKLKKLMENRKVTHEHFDIEDDSIGNSYLSIFKKYLNDNVLKVIIKDPYIRTVHQAHNLLRFVELLLIRCTNLRTIELETTQSPENEFQNQVTRLNSIVDGLAKYKVNMSYTFSTTLHDRSIDLGNGWVVKIGRGLDYFKSCPTFTPGFHEQDLRHCHQTTVDVFYS